MPDFNENKGFKLGGFPMIDGTASVMKQKAKLSEYEQAFSDARSAGKDVFDYKGEQHNTMQLGEEGWVEGSDALKASGQNAYQTSDGGSTILNAGSYDAESDTQTYPTWSSGNKPVPVAEKKDVYDPEDDNNSPQAITNYKLRMAKAGKQGQTKEN